MALIFGISDHLHVETGSKSILYIRAFGIERMKGLCVEMIN